MTNILLSIIAVLLFARIVLQVRQGKRALEKVYAATSEVENKTSTVIDEYDLRIELDNWGRRGYELVSVVVSGHNDKDDCNIYTLFFTRKKIKNYYEE